MSKIIKSYGHLFEVQLSSKPHHKILYKKRRHSRWRTSLSYYHYYYCFDYYDYLLHNSICERTMRLNSCCFLFVFRNTLFEISAIHLKSQTWNILWLLLSLRNHLYHLIYLSDDSQKKKLYSTEFKAKNKITKLWMKKIESLNEPKVC